MSTCPGYFEWSLKHKGHMARSGFGIWATKTWGLGNYNIMSACHGQSFGFWLKHNVLMPHTKIRFGWMALSFLHAYLCKIMKCMMCWWCNTFSCRHPFSSQGHSKIPILQTNRFVIKDEESMQHVFNITTGQWSNSDTLTILTSYVKWYCLAG